VNHSTHKSSSCEVTHWKRKSTIKRSNALLRPPPCEAVKAPATCQQSNSTATTTVSESRCGAHSSSGSWSDRPHQAAAVLAGISSVSSNTPFERLLEDSSGCFKHEALYLFDAIKANYTLIVLFTCIHYTSRTMIRRLKKVGRRITCFDDRPIFSMSKSCKVTLC
jgi:hypothetical protein